MEERKRGEQKESMKIFEQKINFYKMTCFVMLLYLLPVKLCSQNILQTEITIDHTNETIKKILKDIQEENDFSFSYSQIDLSDKISIKYSGTLESGLNRILPSKIIYENIGNFIILKNAPLKGRKIKGRVIDKDTQIPLIGASVIIIESDPLIGVSTDENGYFEFERMPIDRYDFYAQYLGYEPLNVSQVLNSAGKEVFLNIELTESAVSFSEIIVTDKLEYGAPINEMAGASARSFSVEETRRYAASISDPARMAQSFAGVSSGGDDLSNEIIIRGNSTRGLLWRLEGVEVPNPNHFGGMGNGGGSVSMLSSSTLTNSDFYTGAFPAEYGNALSGVFDMRMRNGNSEKREHSIAVGNLGFEMSTEGYFNKKSKASYLVNFRYSTIQLIRKWLPSLGNEFPAYRDLSFKVNIPTENKGNITLFGLGGRNLSKQDGIRDTSKWEDINDRLDVQQKERVAVIGATHRYLLNDDAYFKTSIAATSYDYYDLTDLILNLEGYPDTTIDESDFRNKDFALYFSFHQKLNAKNKIRTGFNLSHKTFYYDYLTKDPSFSDELFFKNDGRTQFLQSFFQWQKRWKEDLEFNTGVNFSYLFLNNTYAFDPRFSFKWEFVPKNKLILSAGLHSKPEHISTYFIERINPNGTINSPNLNLSLSKAAHFVIGYDRDIYENIKLKIEGYYQHLFNIPVSDNADNGFSVLNTQDVFDIIFGNDRSRSALVSKGTGQNIGVDFTLEKPFTNGHYFLFTTSIFDSKYQTLSKINYPTLTDQGFLFNFLAGKEWKVGGQRKNIFGLNGKFTYYGGRRDQPIDLEASIMSGRQVNLPNSYFAEKLPAYIRFDLAASYTINIFKQTHSIHLDIQNIANRFNVYNRYYDDSSESIVDELQNGLIPFLLYRVQF